MHLQCLIKTIGQFFIYCVWFPGRLPAGLGLRLGLESVGIRILEFGFELGLGLGLGSLHSQCMITR